MKKHSSGIEAQINEAAQLLQKYAALRNAPLILLGRRSDKQQPDTLEDADLEAIKQEEVTGIVFAHSCDSHEAQQLTQVIEAVINREGVLGGPSLDVLGIHLFAVEYLADVLDQIGGSGTVSDWIRRAYIKGLKDWQAATEEEVGQAVERAFKGTEREIPRPEDQP